MASIKTTITNNESVRRMAFLAGWPNVKRLKRRFFADGPTVFILMYHKIAPNAYPYYGAAVTPQVFEKQIRTILNHYRVVALEDLVHMQHFAERQDLVAITFDDGYQGVYRWVFPILRKYDLPATVFLTTDFIGTQQLLWHDYLAFILYNGLEHNSYTHIDYAGFPAKIAESLQSFFRDEINSAYRLESLRQTSAYLKSYSVDDRKRIINKLCANLRLATPFDFSGVMLSWREIHQMSRHRISFGSHTCSHEPLSRLSPQCVDQELRNSKNKIESQLQKPVISFAYPYGKQDDFTSANMEQVQRCGFQLAVTGIRGNESLPSRNPYALRRRAVENTPYLFY